MRQVVILHGWSDTSASFTKLAGFLRAHGYDAVPLWLGDYISMEDDVRVEDVGKRMEQVVRAKMASDGLQAPFDLIVHSTGGLVAREWISACYTGRIEQCPAKRLVMLAPANFGSRLASMGQSMLGRLVKGWDHWFHTGKEMLDALELGSPYQWDLVRRDMFTPQGSESAPALYAEDGVWPFIIVGSHPYPSALRQIVNENGTDGTVRVPAANLNTRGITIDFAANEDQPVLRPWTLRAPDPFPFAVLPDRTHASIIKPGKSDVPTPAGYQDRLGDLILTALACDSRSQYEALVAQWRDISEHTAVLSSGENGDYFHQYLQLNVRVVDDHGQEVNDYFLEFCGPDDEKGDQSTVYFHRQVLEDVHTNGQNASLRCLYVDRTDLVDNYYGKIPPTLEKVLNMSISATSPGKNIGYFENAKHGAKGTMAVHRENAASPESRWLKRNTTHFVEIVIPRNPMDKVFRLKQYVSP